jgi:hypothetical protein
MAFGNLGEEIKADPDMILEDSAWPSATNKDTDVFLLGGAGAGVEVVGVNTGSAATGALTVSIKTSDNATDAVYASTTGTYATTTLVSEGTTGSWALDDEIFRYVPDSGKEAYASIRLTTLDDLSAEKIDIYQHPIDR